MLKLKEIIKKLGDENFHSLVSELEETKAEKFQKLLIFYREGLHSDDEIINSLQLNVNAFYTLKSRLFDKIQQKLTKELGGSSAGLIEQVTHIPQLLYATPRDVAIATLKKLEKDLLDNDLYNELIPVYGALKKLHYNTNKYFTYSQQYNRHIAYTLALGKASDLVCDFCRVMEEYFVSRTPLLRDQLGLIKKELDNHYKLNQSHQLFLYKAIADISCSLFIIGSPFSNEDDPIDEILQKVEGIFKEYTQEPSYEYLMQVFNFLSFTYYNKLGLSKNAQKHFDRIIESFPDFLEFDHTVFSYHFLVDLLPWRLLNEDKEQLKAEAEALSGLHAEAELSIPQKIIIGKFIAAKHFCFREFDKSAQVLQRLINEISFKHFAHTEIEIKLLLALAQVLTEKGESAMVTLRSVTRKIRESGIAEQYESVKTWSKLIHLLLKNPYDGIKKATEIIELFEVQNKRAPVYLNFFIPEVSLIKGLNSSQKN